MHKLRNLIFVLLTILVFFIPSCNNETNVNSDDSVPTIMVTDDIGREVEVPETVERIAALYSFAGYAVCLLGKGNNLVAVPGGLQRDILLVDLFPEVGEASVPREGGTVNVEELLKIKPDIVIVRLDNITDEKEKEKLDNTDIPYIVVDFSTMEEQQQSLLLIGKTIGAEDAAIAYNQYYNDVIDRVEQVTSQIPEDKKTTLLYSENQATRATASTSVAADWTKAAGVINVSIGEDLQLIGNDYYASIEQILLWNPEVIIVNEPTAYTLITEHPQWSSVKAVVDGKVYQLPNGISRWGHPGSIETPLALVWAAKTIYPDRFPDLDLNEETRYYYKTFFNLDLSDELIDTILEGGDLREEK